MVEGLRVGTTLIILEMIDEIKGVFIWTTEADLKRITSDIAGKSALDLIKEDIANGSNKTGHAKYRKILKDHGMISDIELNQWRLSHAITEKPDP